MVTLLAAWFALVVVGAPPAPATCLGGRGGGVALHEVPLCRCWRGLPVRASGAHRGGAAARGMKKDPHLLVGAFACVRPVGDSDSIQSETMGPEPFRQICLDFLCINNGSVLRAMVLDFA